MVFYDLQLCCGCTNNVPCGIHLFRSIPFPFPFHSDEPFQSLPFHSIPLFIYSLTIDRPVHSIPPPPPPPMPTTWGAMWRRWASKYSVDGCKGRSRRNGNETNHCADARIGTEGFAFRFTSKGSGKPAAAAAVMVVKAETRPIWMRLRRNLHWEPNQWARTGTDRCQGY